MWADRWPNGFWKKSQRYFQGSREIPELVSRVFPLNGIWDKPPSSVGAEDSLSPDTTDRGVARTRSEAPQGFFTS